VCGPRKSSPHQPIAGLRRELPSGAFSERAAVINPVASIERIVG
jgi:hypothetical protein